MHSAVLVQLRDDVDRQNCSDKLLLQQHMKQCGETSGKAPQFWLGFPQFNNRAARCSQFGRLLWCVRKIAASSGCS